MKFTKGLTLNERYYNEIVGPLLHQFDAGLPYSCSLLGYGSDVLGLDDATSMDHNWGPRLQIFLREDDLRIKNDLDAFLSANLPPSFAGLPTNYASQPNAPIKRMAPTAGPPVNHLIEIYGIDAFHKSIVDKPLDDLNDLDWISIPEQVLLETTSGKVFHDGLGVLNPLRALLRYYPPDVKKLKIAVLWDGIAHEEAFIGRCIEHDDYVGAKLISARVVSTVMKICFAIKRQYMPYSKWFTTKFSRLGLHSIEDLAVQILSENNLPLIEKKVAKLYQEVIALNNATAGLPVINNTVRDYYNRPYKVIMAGEIVTLFVDAIESETLKSLELSAVFIDSKIDAADFTNTRGVIQRLASIKR